MTVSVYFYSTIKNCNVNINDNIFSKVNYFLSHTILCSLLNGDGQQRCLCQEIATSN